MESGFNKERKWIYPKTSLWGTQLELGWGRLVIRIDLLVCTCRRVTELKFICMSIVQCRQQATTPDVHCVISMQFGAKIQVTGHYFEFHHIWDSKHAIKFSWTIMNDTQCYCRAPLAVKWTSDCPCHGNGNSKKRFLKHPCLRINRFGLDGSCQNELK